MDRKLKIKIFLRSFFIQSGWNFEKCQNVGFCFVLMPYFKKIWPDADNFKKAVFRHFGIFNTQPYMAGFVIGNVCKMEEAIAAAKSLEEEECLIKKTIGVKAALASSFAAIGDRIFWGRLVPINTMLCVAIWLYSGFYGWFLIGGELNPSMNILFSGPLLGIFIVTVFSLYIRWKGFYHGYLCGGSCSCGLDLMRWPKIISRLSFIGFLLAWLIFISVLFVTFVHYYGNFGFAGLIFKLVLIASAIGIFLVFRKLGKSIFFVLSATLLLSFIIAMFSKIMGMELSLL